MCPLWFQVFFFSTTLNIPQTELLYTRVVVSIDTRPIPPDTYVLREALKFFFFNEKKIMYEGRL